MRKVKRKSKNILDRWRWPFIVFIFSSLLLSLWKVPWRMGIYQDGKKAEQYIQQKKTLEILLEGSEALLKLWREGGMGMSRRSSGLKGKGAEDCREHQGDQGQCQPSFIQCFFEKRDKEKRPHLVVEKQGRKFGVYAQKYTTGYYRIITRENTSGVSIPNYAILVSLSLMMNGRSSDSSLPVLLEDACGEVYLPQRIYAYGPYLKSKDWRWDNFSQNVYIDKNLVTYEDIDEWLDYNASQGEMAKEIRRKVKWPKERLQWKRPVSGLSKKEMKHFCSFRGKQLLEAHYYDAATFHPGDFSNVKPLKNIRGPYPWTNKSMHFFSQNLEFCSKVFTKECLSGPGGERVYEHYRKHSTSWIGMFEILGGVPEAVRNVIDPKKNLKASSYYFSADSSWHKLGMRAYWDGSAFEERNFDWIDVKKNLIEVSFRCMKFTYDL